MEEFLGKEVDVEANFVPTNKCIKVCPGVNYDVIGIVI